ncbi:MAG: ABC transporter permease [Firmicutes bacterium]|nr:ABC transporter permease [Bacillota bacterium]
MNIFKRYTNRSLKSNRSRTLVTIIGIVLSMALLTAVIEGAYSGIQFLIRGEIKKNGKWEAYYFDLHEDERAQLISDPDIKAETYWQMVGWAEAGSNNEYKPYLLIQSVSDDFTDFVSMNITTGRMPENEGEILIPNHLYTNGGVQYKLGDIIHLSVGERLSGVMGLPFSTPYQPGAESIENTVEKTYTVVGFYDRLGLEIEPFSCPGYTAITKGGGTGSYGSFVTVNKLSRIYETLGKKHIGTRFDGPYERINYHDELINYSGTVRSSGLQKVIYGFATILVVMIAFGSISLIYNSFSISLSERTKQFGLLKSIGATKKQLRSSVMHEALILGGIGIPIGLVVGCLGIGITLYCLRDAFSGFLGVRGVQMQIVLNPIALVISALICLAVILISAWIPAGRAVRISPITAIRQNADTRIKPREVKTGRLTQKIFGFEGMMASKSFKRNKKRYRSTIVSLFMSVVLFISASSFCSYLTSSVDSVASDGTQMDLYYTEYGIRDTTPEEIAALISGIPGVDRVCWGISSQVRLRIPNELMSDRYWKLQSGVSGVARQETDYVETYTQLAFINDEDFKALLSENGLNEKGWFDADSPKALLFNKERAFEDGSAGRKVILFDLINESGLPGTVYWCSYETVEGCDMYYIGSESGSTKVAFYPEKYLEECYKKGVDPDPSMAKIIKDEEDATIKTELNIGAVTKSAPMLLSSQNTSVIYPYSMLPVVTSGFDPDRIGINGVQAAVLAREYNKVYEEMKNTLITTGHDGSSLINVAENRNSERMVVTIVNVFSYGFIILISLIALANVFNTVSTSILLRRREFAMLKSIGLSEKGFRKMMDYECVIYGVRSLLFGLPAALLMTYWIYNVTSSAIDRSFYVPWKGVIIAVASVFIVVFATMLYSTHRIRKDNPIDALRNENL